MTACAAPIGAICHPANGASPISSFITGASFRLQLGGEKPNCARLDAPTPFRFTTKGS